MLKLSNFKKKIKSTIKIWGEENLKPKANSNKWIKEFVWNIWDVYYWAAYTWLLSKAVLSNIVATRNKLFNFTLNEYKLNTIKNWLLQPIWLPF